LPPDVRKGFAFPTLKLKRLGAAPLTRRSLSKQKSRFRKGIAFPHIRWQSQSDPSTTVILHLQNYQVDQIIAHAREVAPHECCGLIGGAGNGRAQTIYRTRNIAANPEVTYEAAPEDLFAAQRAMRERDEQLLAIYHSHPRAKDPEPSATDVRLAYYPEAVYFIVGLEGEAPCVRAFRISEREGRWERVEFTVN
jgi:[CysO sulfur-carrier protein]-S-L-cysteine hydrolase